ncbi:MAG: LPXTG cell wall anchor domain-containing protein [Dermatophilaceae bacterium]
MTDTTYAIGHGRRWFGGIPARVAAVGAALALIASALVAIALPAQATTSPFAPLTAFAIDGNIAGPNDWGDPLGSALYGPYTTAGGFPSSGIISSSFATDSCTTDTTGFPGSQTPDTDPWSPGTANVNTKDDLCSGGSAIEVVDVNGQYQYVYYSYWARSASATGDMSVFTLLQGPASGRTDDKLISFDYNSAGGGSITVTVYTWNGASWVSAGTLPATQFQSAVGANVSPATGGSAGANGQTFGEFAVNLTTSGILPETTCQTFTAASSIAKTGNSMSAQLQDYLTYTTPVTMNSCGGLTVVKATEPAGATGGPFGYSITQRDGKQVYDATLGNAAGEPSEIADGTPGLITGTLTVSGDPATARDTWGNVIGSPDYVLAETSTPSGWAAKEISCTYYDPFLGRTVTTVYPGATASTFQVPSYTLSPGGTTCTITNTTSQLRIVKAGSGDTSVPFPFTVTGQPAPIPLTIGQTSATLQYTPGTAVTISEALPTTGIPWTSLGAVCRNSAGAIVASSTGTAVTVTTVGGDTITCTYTNRQQAALYLRKDIRPDDSTTTFDFIGSFFPGTVPLGDFRRTDGTLTGVGVYGPVYVTPDQRYWATEITDPDLPLSTIFCLDPTDDSTFDLATATATYNPGPGETVTCSFINTAPGSITIVKRATPSSLQDFAFTTSGTGLPASFTLDDDLGTGGGLGGDNTYLSNTTFSGLTEGTYSFTEGSVPGWALTTLSCVGGSVPASYTGSTAQVTLSPNESITCTYVNTRASANLTLRKQWVNPVAGDQATLVADALEQPHVASATSTSTGTSATDTTNVATIPIYAGDSIALRETIPATQAPSYTSQLSCTDGAGTRIIPLTGLQGTYAVPTAPTDVTCTFVNTALEARVVLTKDWASSPVDTSTVDLGITDPRGSSAGFNSNDATANDLDAALSVVVGRTVQLTETFRREVTAGHWEQYTTTLSCANGTATPSQPQLVDPVNGQWSAQLAIDAADADTTITCTFRNVRRTATLSLHKEWVYGAAGESVSLTIDALNAPAPDPATSTVRDHAPSPFLDMANATTVTAYAGETLSLQEEFLTSLGAYTTLLTCQDGDGVLSGAIVTVSGNIRRASFTIPDSPTARYTCAFTNTRLTSQLTVRKAWVGAEAGDTATMTGTGLQTGTAANATSTSDGATGTFLDTTNVVTLTPLTGELVDIGEVLNATSGHAYAATLSCTYTTATNATPQPLAVTERAGLPWQITVPADPTAVTTCTITNTDVQPKLTLVKALPNNGAGTRTLADFPLTAAGPTTITGTSGTVAVTGVEVPAGTYALSEPAVAGYTPSVWSCVNDTAGTTWSFTSGTAGSGTGSVTLVATDDVVCTITNTAPTSQVQVTKTVTGVDPSQPWAFTFALTPTPEGQPATQNATGTGPTTATPVTWTGLTPGSSYTLTETPTPGYDPAAMTCTGTLDTDGDPTNASVTFTAPLNTLTTPEITCTITNTAPTSQVQVTKTVTGVDPSQPWAFTFALTPTPEGQPATQNATGTGPTTATPVTWTGLTPGSSYTLTETPTPGYDPAAMTCTGTLDTDGDPTNASVTFTAPLNTLTTPEITCTITNTAPTSQVQVTKTVTGVDPSQPWAFTFALTPTPEGQPATQNATGTGPTTATPVTWTGLTPGSSYTITETPTTGYDPAAMTCTGTLDTDGDPTNASVTFTAPLNTLTTPEITCTITNTAQPATLRLDKVVVNDDAGDALAEDFPMSATGLPGTLAEQTPLPGVVDTDPASGTTNANVVNAGTYRLSETTSPLYTAGTWSCWVAADPTQAVPVVAGPAGSGTGEVTLGLGQDVTCTITNDDNSVDLEVTKSDGGITAKPATPFPYTLTVRNIGLQDVSDGSPVTLTDVLPDQLVYVSGPPECAADGQTVTCALDPADLVAGGPGVQIVLQVQFRPGTPSGTYTNLAYVDTPEDPAPEEPVCVPPNLAGARRALAAATDPANNVACDDTPVVTTYGLAVVKSGIEVAADGTRTPTDGVVDFGSTVAYEMAVEATGDAPQTNVTLTDTIPVGTAYVEGSAGCLAPDTCVATYDPATRTVTAVIGQMSPGDVVVVTLSVTVDPAAALAPGMSYTWKGANVAAARSTEVPTDVPSNVVTVTATASELPKTGTEAMSVGVLGLLTLLLGAALVLLARRRGTRRTRGH